MAKAPFALRLGFTLVDDGFFLGRNIADQLSLSARRAHSLIAAYAMSEPEKAFARRVLRNKRNLWLFRCHQRRFCGDFAIVDMSAGVAAERRALVVELKERRALEVGIAPGSQLAQAPAVIGELVHRELLSPASEVVLAIGDSDEVYEWLDTSWPRDPSGPSAT
ncbi:MAG: hypothetical protein R3B72_38000 [Polyangiaceae bacterium]